MRALDARINECNRTARAAIRKHTPKHSSRGIKQPCAEDHAVLKRQLK
jgi:hypothetical protein